MEAASIPAASGTGSAAGDKGLKANAITYISTIVIAVASTAPGYSLAATLGFIVAIEGIGVQAPAVILVAFIPMGCIAAAYNYMNRADPDCGTTFSWVSLAMGPKIGWFSGWAVIVADVLVMPSLASVAAIYSCDLFGYSDPSTIVILIIGVVWIVLMTAICYIGIELSARTQQLLLAMEIFTLTLFAVVALVKVYGSSPEGAIKPQFSWFNPFDISAGALASGVLLAIFIYWGWDSAVSVNEETEDGGSSTGRAAVLATFILLGTYVVIAAATQAYGGTQSLIDNQTDVFAPIAKSVLGSPLDKLLIIAVLTSASASTQTTILPATRSSLSMARHGAIPKSFGKIHPRYLTPSDSTIWMGVVSVLTFVVLQATSENLVADAFTSLAMTIAFYYGITGFACTIYYRKHLLDSAKAFISLALLPTFGGIVLTAVFVKAVIEYSKVDGGYAKPLLGVGSPVIITVFMIVLGIVLFAAQYVTAPEFFRRKTRIADDAQAAELFAEKS